MRTRAHRIVDTDPKRGNVVVRVTGTRHDEPTYQVRQSQVPPLCSFTAEAEYSGATGSATIW
ncbi:hypothetical protein DMH04_46010 [Kibdelosporangium aridum]|uniref:Uncharacterized protein n=1 Tax=Kibdelosporangium aridum TaxID=2030 RepID=A0A428YN93_KIBAR|nr:hypothetical protein [Kibdelosporangium aridum]RSM69675.1 hypothetical protein DMH04_46010 [Kibdelosporangium aridum]